MDPLFEVHKLNEEGFKKAALLATAYENLATAIEECVGTGPSREKALARTKLEESCFFAKKALAVNPANQA